MLKSRGMLKYLITIITGGVASTVATFLLSVVLTHILSVEDYGVMARWLTDISFVSIFFTLGLNTSMVYIIRTGIHLSSSISFNIIIYSMMLLLGVAVSVVLLGGDVYTLTLLGSVYFFAINEVIRAYYQYERRFSTFNFLVVFRPILLLIVFSAILLLIDTTSLSQSLYVYLGVMLVSTILCFFIYSRDGHELTSPFDGSMPYRAYFTYGTKSILNKLLSLALYALSIYMISWVGDGGYTFVAYFFVANSISKMVWVLPDSVGNVLYPSFMRATTEDSRCEAIESMYTYAQLVFLLNIIAFCAFYVLGAWVIELLYEKSYHVSLWPTLILLIGNQGMVYYKLFSRWHASQNTWRYVYFATLAGIVTNVLLNLLLIPRYGLIGVSVATGVSFWVCGLVISYPTKGAFVSFLNLRSLWQKRKRLLTGRI